MVEKCSSGDARLPKEVVLPLSLAQLRQRYNSAAKLVNDGARQTLLERVSILCGSWNMYEL
jgi:hypothetical protein